MFRFAAARSLAAVPVLLGVSVVVFLTMKLIPGDAAQVLAGPQATADQVALIRQSLGLDRPLYVQYARWLDRAVRGDLGRSIQLDAPVSAATSQSSRLYCRRRSSSVNPSGKVWCRRVV